MTGTMAKQDSYKYFTIKIPPEMHSEIKSFCVKKNITMRQFAIDCFTYNIEKAENQKLQGNNAN